MAGRVFKRSKRFPGHLCMFHAACDRVFPPFPRPAGAARLLRRLLSSLVIPWKGHFAFRNLRTSTCTREYDQCRHANAKNWKIVHPHSKFFVAWQAIMIVVIAASLILKPFVICFIHVHYFSGVPCESTCLTRSLSVAAFIVDMLFAVNILVKFRTGVCDYQHGTVIMGRRLVVAHYCQTWFLPDISTCTASAHLLFYVLIKTVSDEESTKLILFILHMISMMSFYRLHELLDYLRTWVTILGAKQHITQVVRLIVGSFIFCHYMACLHFWFPIIIHGKDVLNIQPKRQSWMAEYNTTICGEFALNYLQCFDRTFSFITGFGFKFPETSEDQYLFLINSWIGKAILVYVIAISLQISQMNNRSSILLERTMRELKQYMELRKMPAKLQQRLLHYFNYRLQTTFFDEKKIFDSLPPEVKNDVKFYSCRSIMEGLPMFQNVPRKLMNAAALECEERLYLRNDAVYAAGDAADGVYFVSSGTLMVAAPDGAEIGHVPEGGSFGEAESVRGNKRATSVIALETCELFFLPLAWMERHLMSSAPLRATLNAAALAAEATAHDAMRRRSRTQSQRSSFALSLPSRTPSARTSSSSVSASTTDAE